MKLKKLYIEEFKNLDRFTLDFSNNDGLTVLIGNNGSGKSNILEAISMIFIDLKAQNNDYALNYTLEYEIENKQIKIENYCSSRRFTIDGIENETLNKDYLPQRIIACYSGEVIRLWEIYKEHYYNTNRKKINTYNNPFLYIDLAELDIHKLASVYNEICETLIEDDEEKIEMLIEKYVSFELKINLNSYHKGLVKNQELMRFISSIVTDDNKINYTSLVDYFNSVLPNTKQDFLNYLFNCKSRQLIEWIELDEQNLLSEGEQKLNLIELLFDILAEKNTLILIDEIDSHIHVANKKKIKELIEKAADIENEIILVTHSPTLTHHFNDNHITMINDGKVEDKTKQEIFSHISDGIWNYQEQSIFLSSPYKIDLLVEGKFDQIHIEKALNILESDFPGLKCGIFDLDGCEKQKKFFDAVCNAKNLQIEDKKLIFIFDNEKQFINNDEIKAKELRGAVKIEENIYVKNNIYIVFLPKKDGHDDNFTIENMYDASKYKECLAEAFEFITIDKCNDFIDNISDNIKESSKKLLADNCKDFNNDDFEHFKKLFDLIKTIEDL